MSTDSPTSATFSTLELQAFVVSAEQESFERAAALLDVTSTTVGRRVKGYEDAWGMKLFVRSPAGVELTDDGRYMFAEAVSLQAKLEELQSASGREKAEVASKYWTETPVGRIMCRRRVR